MKTELEQQDIEAIAQRVVELVRPIVSGNSKSKGEDTIYDVKGLAEYLKVSTKWIYERTHLKEIPHYKLGNNIRFRKNDIDNWMISYTIPAVDTPEGILKKIRQG